MGFRYVEPETREPQPTVPMRWVVLGTVVFLVLPFLPVFFGLALGFLSVLQERHHDAPTHSVSVPVFDQSELEATKRVYPEYPDAAKSMGLPPQRCLADVRMDDEGTPYDVQVTSCPDVFEAPTREALLRWQWNPPTTDGHPTAARTTIAVTYKLADDWPAIPADVEREARRAEARARLEIRRQERDVDAAVEAYAAEGETRLDLDLSEH